MLLVAVLILALLVAGAAFAAGTRRATAAGPTALGGAALVGGGVVWAVAAGARPAEIGWLPEWGWSLHLGLDALGATYALLAAGVAVPVLAYSIAYLTHHLHETGAPAGRRARFFGWMALFLGSMVGLAVAQDLISLFVFFDLTALCSWALIGFDRERREARSAALTAFVLTAATSVGFLLGIVLLERDLDAVRISVLLERAGDGGAGSWAMALVALAALAKSAQAPLHFWLPRAMVAPTPVSAYLHSAAMVAAGVFVIHRLHPLFPAEVASALLAIGWLSIVVGSVGALTASELKRILAYSTIAQYGHMVALLGLGGAKAAAAVAVFVLVHGVAKSALFLTAGAVTQTTGSSDLGALGGLGRRMPALAAASAVAAAAIAGLPLTAGFFKDESFFSVLSEHGAVAQVAGALALALSTAYMWRFWAGLFLGSRAGRGERPPAALTLPIAALAAVLLAGGVLGSALAQAGRAAAAAVHPVVPSFELAYHFDLRTTNLMALGGWLLGALLAASRRVWLRALEPLAEPAAAAGPGRIWDRGIAGLDHLSDRLRLFEIDDLRDRVASILVPAAIVVAIALGAGWSAARFAYGIGPERNLPLTLALLATLLSGAAATRVRSHLAVVLMLSAVGFSLAVVFALLGAPDLALVAVLVETALTLLFVVALRRLPARGMRRTEPAAAERRNGAEDRRKGADDRRRAGWHTAAALVSGVTAVLVVWRVLSNPAAETVAARYVELAPEAHAGNVVAAILADFRGLDTLVEVSVLVVAMLGLRMLLRRDPRRHPRPGAAS